MAQKEIGFVGCDCTDIILYIARLYAASGKKTAVIDHTEGQMLLRSVPLPEGLMQQGGYYKGILVQGGLNGSKEDCLGQDVILHSFGYNKDAPELQGCHSLVFVTDMVPCHAELLQGVKAAEGMGSCLLVYGYLPMKYGEEFLMETMGRQFDDGHVFLLAQDDRDYKARCYLRMDKRHRLSLLSSQMRNTVMGLFLCMDGRELGRKERAALWRNA